MKPCGCGFCNDLRNIEPAKYISGGNDEFKKLIAEAKEKKQFVYHWNDDEYTYFAIVDKCPECGYEFTEEDYDDYF